MECESLKYRIHRRLSEQIREGCEDRMSIRIRPRWFALGNIYPDCSHQRLLHMHELSSAGGMVERKIRRFCKKPVRSGTVLSCWNSFRLGVITHYVCDFNCYVHTASFTGSLREHRAYETEQGRHDPALTSRSLCSFHGARNEEELVRMFTRTLTARGSDTYSPAADLEYAAASATELSYAMLRIRADRRRIAWWRRLPLLRRRLARAS